MFPRQSVSGLNLQISSSKMVQPCGEENGTLEAVKTSISLATNSSINRHLKEIEELRKRVSKRLKKWPAYNDDYSLQRWLRQYRYNVGKSFKRASDDRLFLYCSLSRSVSNLRQSIVVHSISRRPVLETFQLLFICSVTFSIVAAS